MARQYDSRAADLDEDEGGLTGFLAEEEGPAVGMMLRLGAWAACAVGAVALAIVAGQTSVDWRQERIASAELVRQSQAMQRLARDSQGEATRLTSAVETLSSDRDRLFSRLSQIEQGLDSVTGSIARQAASIPNSEPSGAPSVQAPASQPATVAMLSLAPAQKVTPRQPESWEASADVQKSPAQPVTVIAEPATPPARPEREVSSSMAALPDQDTDSVSTPSAAPPADGQTPIMVNRTEFGLDIGGADSLDRLRALWSRLGRSHKILSSLKPVVIIREDVNGTQLHLVAGPIGDAATAAKACASLNAANRPCEATVYQGQKLTFANGSAPSSRRPLRRQTRSGTPAPAEPMPPKSSLSSFIGAG